MSHVGLNDESRERSHVSNESYGNESREKGKRKEKRKEMIRVVT
jgi:hypothetical protein